MDGASVDDRDGRWRLLGAAAIILLTALVVLVTRGTGNAEAPTSTGVAVLGTPVVGISDTAFLQRLISMDDSAIVLLVSLQSDSVVLRDLAGQLVESHAAELYDLRVALAGLGAMEDTSLRQGSPAAGVITAEDLVALTQTPVVSRDARAIELLYRHLTEGARLARDQARTSTSFAVTTLAARISTSRTAQLAQLANLPTAERTPAGHS